MGGVAVGGGEAPAGETWATRLAALRAELVSAVRSDGSGAGAALDDAERLTLLSEMELLTRSLAGVGVRAQVAFADSQIEDQRAEGIPASRRGKGIPADLGAARMTSPWWASRQLSSARALVEEMPRTLEALEDGVIDAAQSRVITEATFSLSPDQRAEVDARLAERLPGASTKEISAAARGLVYEIDPEAFVRRARKAAEDRGVSCRPCPDVMGLLSARLPAPQAIAAYAALKEHATAARASGDPRTLQQLMADTLFERLTGRSVVDGIDVEVGVVITDAALFDGTSDTADLTGYGPIPADLARDLLRTDAAEDAGRAQETPTAAPTPPAPEVTPPSASAPSTCRGAFCTDFSCPGPHGATPAPTPPVGQPASGTAAEPPTSEPAAQPPSGARAATVWLRRLYVDPVTGVLTDQDGRRRLFTGKVRKFVVARDRTCRTPWCGAPIRTVDHKVRHRDGGPTTSDNGQGLCEACNLAREHPRATSTEPESYRDPPPVLPIYYGPDGTRPRRGP